jgi:hypothetical protein
LYSYIKEHTVESFIFSERTLRCETMLLYNKIMNADISQENLEKGKLMVEKMEKDFYENLEKFNENPTGK